MRHYFLLTNPSTGGKIQFNDILLKLNDDSLFITYINYIASDNLWYLK